MLKIFFKYTCLLLMLTTFIVAVGLKVTGNEHIYRAFQFTYMKGNSTANINDGKDFETKVIESAESIPWSLHENYNANPLDDELESYLRSTKSAAFLVIHNGELHSEFYFEPYNNRSKTNSFSMAKSIMTLMIGAAIDEGIIRDFDDLAKKYVPELEGVADEVSIAHLSAMSSGVDWEENYYSPFSPTPKLLYGYDVEEYTLSREYPATAGSEYYYASVSTQLLGIVLSRALESAKSEESLSGFLSRKFWKPMGMNDSGTWHTDAKGMELVYCCINSNPRNFAKFGLLLSQQGRWGEQQLVSPEFVQRMIKPDLVHYYGHSIWNDDRNPAEFYLMMGHLGQYVIVVPEHDIIVVRLGEFRKNNVDKITRFIPGEVAYYVEQAIKRIKPLH